MTARPRWLIGAVLLGVLGIAPAAASAEVQLALPAGSLPGFHAVAASPAAARADLASGLPAPLSAFAKDAFNQISAARRSGLALRSDAFVFGSPAAAVHVLSAWRRARGARAAALGYEAGARRTFVVAWRDGARIGVIALTASRRVHDPHQLAERYAVLADGWLRAPLPATAWGLVLDAIRPDGTVSKATALQAFSVVYGPLPDVPIAPGARTTVPSGTLAAQWILSYFKELTRPQQRVVERLLGVRVAGRAARAASYGDPGFHPTTKIQTLAQEFISDYEPLLGHTLGLKVIAGETTTVEIDPKTKAIALADAEALNAQGNWGSGTPVACRIRVMPAGDAQSTERLRVSVAHEVFHCFQFDLRGTGAWNLPASWIIEGGATWAADTVAATSYDDDGGWITNYLFSPTKPLFERAYDAVGFWGHAEDVFPGVFKRMASILNAGSNGASFDLAVGVQDAFLTSWGSSPFRAKGIAGPPWQMHSPINPPAYGVLPLNAETIDPSIIGGNGTVYAPPLTTAQYLVTSSSAEPVLHVAIHGHARLGLSENYTDLKNAWFCTRPGECFCPAGTTGSVPPTEPLPSGAALGISGDPDVPGTYGDITSYPLSHFCQPKQPSPSPTSGNSGVSNGDPYMTTFEGISYAFQTAGEFTLAKSITDDLEVQARQVPYPQSTEPALANSLAMNTAFAMRDSGATVELDKGSPLVLYIDHRRRRARPGQTIALPGGGSVRYGARLTVVTWRDGTRAQVLSIGADGVNIAVTPSKKRAGLLRGLLGADGGRPADDFIGRTGHRYVASQLQNVGLFVDMPDAIRILVGEFGRSWRIKQRESLFVYPPGKTTRSYLVPGFPHVPVSLHSLSKARRRTAAQVCRGAGVTNAGLLAGCEIDYGATGSHLLATSTAAVQHAVPTLNVTTGTGVNVSPVPWTQLSAQLGTSYGHPSIATTGGQVVAAYHRQSDQAIETATFTAGAGGVSGLSRTVPFTSWLSTLDPVLLSSPGGGLQAIIAGTHSGGSDPLNGTLLVPRGADGSFGSPTLLDPMLGYGATSATLAADGSTPLWASAGGFGAQLLVFSGTTQHDLTADSPGFTSIPAIGRDSTGRVWLAWSVFSETRDVSGLYMVQLDPQTGVALRPATEAPNSNGDGTGVGSFAMPCAQVCRLLYVNPAGAEGEEILSWAPGEAAKPVVSGLINGHQQGLGEVAGAYTPSGRLWIGWTDVSPGIEYAKLGDATGAGGNVISLPKPPVLARGGFDLPARTVALTIGDRLVLVTLWNDGLSSGSTSVWATVVNPQ